jgi:gliding motility-associated-like protein
MAPWDGTFDGKALPTADYYYILDLGNGQTYNGVVTLKK